MLLAAGVVGANATKLYATYGTPAGNGSWDAKTGTYKWTGSYSNLMTIFTFANGELADYESLHLTTSDYVDGPYRVCFMNGSTAVATISFYSAGQKDLVLSERTETKDLDLSKITHLSFGGASGSGSIKITKTPYLEKPTEFTFNDQGKAYLYPSDLKATAWGLDSYDEETGIVVKSTTGYGGISFDFGADGFDFSNITNIEINIDGEKDDIRDYANVTDLNNHTQYISATGGAYTLGDNIDSNIKTWNLGLNGKTGTMKINYVCFTSSVLKAAPGEEIAMSNLTSYLFNSETSSFESAGYSPSYRVNENTGAAYFGVDWSGENCQRYTDVEGYKAIRIHSAEGNVPRAMFFNKEGNNQTAFNFTWNTEGYYELSLSEVYSSVNNYKLISVRPQQYTSSSIAGICMVIDNPVYDYSISGSGLILPSVAAALADAAATAIDATGVTKATALTTANPNCLIVANEGMVTNAQNVIVDGTCAKLVLTDGYPFKAPANFTATAATYTTAIDSEVKAGTLCLPFAATLPTGVTAYTLTYTGGDEAMATKVEGAIAANTPVLVNGKGDAQFNGSNADVIASAANVSGALTGVFETTAVPAGSYVLQKGGEGLGFYKVAEGSTINAKPFRAYLTAQGAGARLKIAFADTTTGIESVTAKEQQDGQCFDLQGRRVAQPTKGLYIVNGKKVIMK